MHIGIYSTKFKSFLTILYNEKENLKLFCLNTMNSEVLRIVFKLFFLLFHIAKNFYKNFER